MDVLTSIDPTGSQSSSSDPFHPSFFELAAQSQLQDLIKPAVRYVLVVFAQRNPRYLIKIVNNFDEVYALLLTAVESHYLEHWGASFSENFYGLKRRKRPALIRNHHHLNNNAVAGGSTSASVAASERLTKREIRLSLLFLVGLPYLEAKLEDIWERNGGGFSAAQTNLFGDQQDDAQRSRFSDADSQSMPLTERLKKQSLSAFLRAYPYLKTSYQVWLLVYNIRYLFDRTPYYRPWLQLMRVDIRRSMDNGQPRKPILPTKFPSVTRQPLKFLTTLLRISPKLAAEGLKYGLPASIFFFKFLEWWYGADNPRSRGRGGGRRNNANAGGAGQGGESGSGDLDSSTLDPPVLLHPSSRSFFFQQTNSTSDEVNEKASSTSFDYVPPKVFTILPSPNPEDPSTTRSSPLSKLVKSKQLIHNTCPLCGSLPIKNPAVIPTGYTFCYTCIHNYLENVSDRCPVTNQTIPDARNSIRKVLG